MKDTTFNACIKRLFGRFNRKAPDDDDVRQDAWDAVKHIPDEAVPWIMGKLLDSDKLPMNWVREFRALWDSWRSNNPEKCSKTQQGGTRGCQFCDGGELHVCFERNGQWYTACAPCGHCSPFLPGSITTAAAQARGCVVIQPYVDEAGKLWGQGPASLAWVREKCMERREALSGARNLPLGQVRHAANVAAREWAQG